MAKKKLLEYTIHLRDKTIVNAINAQLLSLAGGPLAGERIRVSGGVIPSATDDYRILRAPSGGADIEYAINAGTYPPALPIINVGDPIPTGGVGYITSPWFTSSNSFPRTVATFTRDDSWWIGGVTQFFWGADVVYSPAGETSGTEGGEPTEAAAIPQRYYISGGHVGAFESGLVIGPGPAQVENLGTPALKNTREGSKDVDGFSWVHNIGSATQQANTMQHPSTRVGSWERLYVDVPEAPNVTTMIWRTQTAATSNLGFIVAITASLTVAVYVHNGAAATLLGTYGTVAIGRNKFEFVTHLDAAFAPNGMMYLDIYRNGAYLASASKEPGGLVGNRYHSTSTIGKELGLSDLQSTARFRFPAWIVAAKPQTRDRAIATYNAAQTYVLGDYVHVGTNPGTWTTYRALQAVGINTPPGPPNTAYWRKITDPIDWDQGSLVQWVRPKAFAATHNSAWGGDWRILGKPMAATASVVTSLSTTTASARCAVEANMATQVDSIPGAIGWVAAAIWVVGTRGVSGTTGVSLGYKVGAAATVDLAVTQSGTVGPNCALYQPAGLTTPIALGTALELHYVHSSFAEACTISQLQGCVEVIGVFGPEDVDPTLTPAPAAPEAIPDRHNCHLPLAPWTRTLSAMGPVMIVGGTYTGNGTGQDLTFKVPPCALWIRNTAGGVGGFVWFPTMLDAHGSFDEGTHLWGGVSVRQDFAFAPGGAADDQQTRWLVTVAGNGADINQAAQTYQYIAFCDPGRRFAYSDLAHVQTNAVPFTEALSIATWTPEWAFLVREQVSSSTVNSVWAKSYSMAVDAVKEVTGGAMTASGLTFGTGALTIRSGFVSADYYQFPYLLFRRSDGNNDPGEAKVMFMGSYTGDGTASRTVSLAGVTGLRPMFAIVHPENAAYIWRDPSNTTNTSNVTTGGTTTTGITAGGIDQFAVGSTLNANGVVYHYFGFYGSATAGNANWSVNTELTPVDTESVEVFEPAVINDTVPTPDTTALDPGELNTDIAATCVTASTRVTNLALSRIGVSKSLSNLATDTSEEAFQARLVYKTEIDATLRDFPWPFATRYATLTLVAGSAAAPVNGDWDRSYRTPADSLFIRRLVNPDDQRAFSREPIPFRLGQDATGDLVYCNEPGTSLPAGAAVTVEYTKRLDCPARFGDSIFRSAAAWRLARALVAPLAKDLKLVDFCEKQYLRELKRAQTVHAREQEHQQLESDGDAGWIAGR